MIINLLICITINSVRKIAAGDAYSAISALTNILAMLFAAFLYECFLTDSDRGKRTSINHQKIFSLSFLVVSHATYEFGVAHANHRRHLELRSHEVLPGGDAEAQTPTDKTNFTYEHSEIAKRA